MKTLFIIALSLTFPFMASAQNKILLHANGNRMSATLVDNEATRTLLSLLENGPVTVSLSDYGGFEKVGALPQSLPTSNSRITTEPGDIMLYQGNNIVFFYGSNTWSYTPLGKIDGASAENIRQFLGTGDVSLTITLNSSDGIPDIRSTENSEDAVYDLNGKRINHRPLAPGLYIINGKKTLIE